MCKIIEKPIMMNSDVIDKMYIGKWNYTVNIANNIEKSCLN
jgi:hypothetical protein